jgi:hypothetical protein
MDVLTAARAQMEVSLAFHMIFAALGIGMPLLMLIAEGQWLRTGRPHYRALARTWAKATALAFRCGHHPNDRSTGPARPEYSVVQNRRPPAACPLDLSPWPCTG